MKVFLAVLHEITESVEESSTISKVLIKNGGVPRSCKASIGCGEADDDDAEPPGPAAEGASASSIFTLAPSITAILSEIWIC